MRVTMILQKGTSCFLIIIMLTASFSCSNTENEANRFIEYIVPT